jgi:superfamily II DNA or RNA helicase
MASVNAILERPALGPLKVGLRPYQDDAVSAVDAEFARGRKSTLLVLPTGTGKTITFGMLVRRCISAGGRALVLAHRGELIDQAVNKLDLLGVEAAVEKAGQRARSLYDPDAVVATVQTMQKKRLASWPRDHFDLVITDEAHHATATSYRSIYRHFRGANHLGVTATADRADEECLSSVFESVAYEMSLWEAMTAAEPGPYLCRLRFVQCDVDIDLRDIRTTAGDFNLGDLEARITPLVETLANAIRQEIGGRKTLVFTPDVGSAQAMAGALKSLGLEADWASGDDRDRETKVAKFRRNEIRVLCNCSLFTEGFDEPDISAIALCRPTKSRSLYAQMVGRGTRLAHGKPDCLLVDFNYLTAKHDLVRPVELFDTSRVDPEILQIAQETADKEPGTDLLDAVEKAKDEHARRQVLKIRAREREIKYRKVSYDPLAVYETFGLPIRGSLNATMKPATEGQVRYLEGFGVKDAAKLSKTKASTLIDYLADRRKRNLCTMKQCSWLIAKGIDPAEARNMNFHQASTMLDQLFRQGVR